MHRLGVVGAGRQTVTPALVTSLVAVRRHIGGRGENSVVHTSANSEAPGDSSADPLMGDVARMMDLANEHAHSTASSWPHTPSPTSGATLHLTQQKVGRILRSRMRLVASGRHQVSAMPLDSLRSFMSAVHCGIPLGDLAQLTSGRNKVVTHTYRRAFPRCALMAKDGRTLRDTLLLVELSHCSAAAVKTGSAAAAAASTRGPSSLILPLCLPSQRLFAEGPALVDNALFGASSGHRDRKKTIDVKRRSVKGNAPRKSGDRRLTLKDAEAELAEVVNLLGACQKAFDLTNAPTEVNVPRGRSIATSKSYQRLQTKLGLDEDEVAMPANQGCMSQEQQAAVSSLCERLLGRTVPPIIYSSFLGIGARGQSLNLASRLEAVLSVLSDSTGGIPPPLELILTQLRVQVLLVGLSATAAQIALAVSGFSCEMSPGCGAPHMEDAGKLARWWRDGGRAMASDTLQNELLPMGARLVDLLGATLRSLQVHIEQLDHPHGTAGQAYHAACEVEGQRQQLRILSTLACLPGGGSALLRTWSELVPTAANPYHIVGGMMLRSAEALGKCQPSLAPLPTVHDATQAMLAASRLLLGGHASGLIATHNVILDMEEFNALASQLGEANLGSKLLEKLCETSRRVTARGGKLMRLSPSSSAMQPTPSSAMVTASEGSGQNSSLLIRLSLGDGLIPPGLPSPFGAPSAAIFTLDALPLLFDTHVRGPADIGTLRALYGTLTTSLSVFMRQIPATSTEALLHSHRRQREYANQDSLRRHHQHPQRLAPAGTAYLTVTTAMQDHYADGWENPLGGESPLLVPPCLPVAELPSGDTLLGYFYAFLGALSRCGQLSLSPVEGSTSGATSPLAPDEMSRWLREAYDNFVSWTPEAYWRHPLILYGLLQCTSSVGDEWKSTVLYQQLVAQKRASLRHADITAETRCVVPGAVNDASHSSRVHSYRGEMTLVGNSGARASASHLSSRDTLGSGAVSGWTTGNARGRSALNERATAFSDRPADYDANAREMMVRSSTVLFGKRTSRGSGAVGSGAWVPGGVVSFPPPSAAGGFTTRPSLRDVGAVNAVGMRVVGSVSPALLGSYCLAPRDPHKCFRTFESLLLYRVYTSLSVVHCIMGRLLLDHLEVSDRNTLLTVPAAVPGGASLNGASPKRRTALFRSLRDQQVALDALASREERASLKRFMLTTRGGSDEEIATAMVGELETPQDVILKASRAHMKEYLVGRELTTSDYLFSLLFLCAGSPAQTERMALFQRAALEEEARQWRRERMMELAPVKRGLRKGSPTTVDHLPPPANPPPVPLIASQVRERSFAGPISPTGTTVSLALLQALKNLVADVGAVLGEEGAVTRPISPPPHTSTISVELLRSVVTAPSIAEALAERQLTSTVTMMVEEAALAALRLVSAAYAPLKNALTWVLEERALVAADLGYLNARKGHKHQSQNDDAGDDDAEEPLEWLVPRGGNDDTLLSALVEAVAISTRPSPYHACSSLWAVAPLPHLGQAVFQEIDSLWREVTTPQSSRLYNAFSAVMKALVEPPLNNTRGAALSDADRVGKMPSHTLTEVLLTQHLADLCDSTLSATVKRALHAGQLSNHQGMHLSLSNPDQALTVVRR